MAHEVTKSSVGDFNVELEGITLSKQQKEELNSKISKSIRNDIKAVLENSGPGGIWDTVKKAWNSVHITTSGGGSFTVGGSVTVTAGTPPTPAQTKD